MKWLSSVLRNFTALSFVIFPAKRVFANLNEPSPYETPENSTFVLAPSVLLLSADGNPRNSGVIVDISRKGSITQKKILAISYEKSCASFMGGVVFYLGKRAPFKLEGEPISLPTSSYEVCLLDIPEDSLPHLEPALLPALSTDNGALVYPSQMVMMHGLLGGFSITDYSLEVETTTEGNVVLKNTYTGISASSWSGYENDARLTTSPYAPILSTQGHFLGFVVDTIRDKFTPDFFAWKTVRDYDKKRMEWVDYFTLAEVLSQSSYHISQLGKDTREPKPAPSSPAKKVIKKLYKKCGRLFQSEQVPAKECVEQNINSSSIQLLTPDKTKGALGVVVGQDLFSHKSGYYILTVAPVPLDETSEPPVFTLAEWPRRLSQQGLAEKSNSSLQAKVEHVEDIGHFSLYFMEPTVGFPVSSVELITADRAFAPFTWIPLATLFVNPNKLSKPPFVGTLQVFTTLSESQWLPNLNDASLKFMALGTPFFEPELGKLAALFQKDEVKIDFKDRGQHRFVPITAALVDKIESYILKSDQNP